MRKIAMMMSLAMVVAADQIIQCRSNPCYASGNFDLVYERVGNGKNDTIILGGGDDKVLASAYKNDGARGCERVSIK